MGAARSAEAKQSHRQITFAEQATALEMSSRRSAWVVAAAMGCIALVEALALAMLAPLKTVEPVVITVDRTTGEVERPVRVKEVADYTPDEALAKAFLHRFVVHRERFYRIRAEEDFLYVSLFLDAHQKDLWARYYRPTNPGSPLNLQEGVEIHAEVTSITFLGDGLASVRLRRRISLPRGRQTDERWTVTIGYAFRPAVMKERDLWRNPLGLQVSSYRRDADVDPE